MPSETKRSTTRVALGPPAFSLPPAMRADYLARRKAELDNLLFQARENNWKQILCAINHVRGSGGMYGFPEIGAAAEAAVLAVQAGSAGGLGALQAYAGVVANTNLQGCP